MSEVPVEDEADVEGGADEQHGREADGQLGREADEDIEQEAEETGTYNSEIKFAGGADLEILAPFPLLGLFGKIRASSPKFIESCDVWPEAPMFSLSAANLLCVGIGLVAAAVGKTLGFA